MHRLCIVGLQVTARRETLAVACGSAANRSEVRPVTILQNNSEVDLNFSTDPAPIETRLIGWYRSTSQKAG